jgi:ankyrin repeat protein
MIGALRLAAPLALCLLVAFFQPARAEISLLPDRANNIVIAVLNNDIEKVRDLLANKGVNPNMTDADGRTALIHAATAGNTPAVKLLLDAGAKATVLDKTGNTAMHYAVERGNTEVLRMMLDAKAPPDLLNRQGATPLMVAAGRGRADIVSLLLERGANVTKQDYTGHDALGWAQDHRQNAIVPILRKAGAK